MNCEGYRKLLAAVEYDEKNHPRFHDYRAKLAWAVGRAAHYAEKTGLTAEEVLDAWERVAIVRSDTDGDGAFRV